MFSLEIVLLPTDYREMERRLAARIFTPQILKSNLKDGYRLEGM